MGGGDYIPPIYFINCASSLTVPLAITYNASLRTGSFPTVWKLAKLIPIFKSGKRDKVENYRLISSLSVLGKIFESLVYPYIYAQLKSFISDRQHGFVHGRSTNSNLVNYSEFLFESVDKCKRIDVVYTDFPKAFDLVPIKVLPIKLSAYGITGSALGWLKSHLNDRCFYVVTNGYKSVTFRTTFEVPQGSHLGPLLFNIFINDLPKCFKYSIPYMFADDFKFLKVIDSVVDVNRVQDDLVVLFNWCNANGMVLNTDKCYFISFTRNHIETIIQYLIADVPLK
ncbi:unnamed protein product [Euphydryas editha]|uniref:Reverse transcriptase domain-containing protein n=1 Tax=Euphydryas editha TaxID=104508 RepID=A0AAU9TZW1_EUPED|nr:unnamed protein product [Euphydryas editha]